MRIASNGTLVGGVAGSGVYTKLVGSDVTQRIVPYPSGTANPMGDRVIGFSGLDADMKIVSVRQDGSDSIVIGKANVSVLVGGVGAWAYSFLGTNTVTEAFTLEERGDQWVSVPWLTLPGMASMWMTDAGDLIVLMSYADDGGGVACYPRGASEPAWSVPGSPVSLRYPYPQLYAVDANRVIWCDARGNFSTYGLPMPASAGVPLVNPFVVTHPDGALWLGYTVSFEDRADETWVRPWDDATRGYKLPGGFGTTGLGSRVAWATDQSEATLESQDINWAAPIVPLTDVAPEPGPVPEVPEVAPLPRKTWISYFFMKSLRSSISNIGTPFGNALTLVGAGTKADGSEIDPGMIRREIEQNGTMALVVADTSAESDPTNNLNVTVIWWVSGADMAALGVAARRALSRPEKPIAAYLDRRGWPAERPDWVTEMVWPSVQAYRAPRESLAEFEAAVRADCDRVAAYGRPFWLTIRLDDWNGDGSLAQTLECLPIYDRLIREYFVVGVHGFSWGRGRGMNTFPALETWGRRLAAATERPNRLDWCTPVGQTPQQTIGAKVAQNVQSYSFTQVELGVLRQAFPYGEPESWPDPNPQMPDPPNELAIVEDEWRMSAPDGTHHGNLAFCRRVARRLGMPWGLNWKRGVVDDPSVDILAYRWGPTNFRARIVDIIGASDQPTLPNGDPNPGFRPIWHVHSIEDAGVVRWYPA